MLSSPKIHPILFSSLLIVYSFEYDIKMRAVYLFDSSFIHIQMFIKRLSNYTNIYSRQLTASGLDCVHIPLKMLYELLKWEEKNFAIVHLGLYTCSVCVCVPHYNLTEHLIIFHKFYFIFCFLNSFFVGN